jgi:preprotein translocase subunit SecG
MSILIGILTAVHVLVALFMIVLVLMQKSSEQGVGAAFGGGMTETVFGAGTTTALVRMTIWCACLLLATTLILAVLHSHRTKTRGSLIQRTLAAPAGQPSQSELPFASQPPAASTPTTPEATPAAPASTPVNSAPASTAAPSQPKKTP